MTLYRVSWDFRKTQPKWTVNLKTALGERNEGVTIEADSPADALRHFGKTSSLNTFYLKAEKVTP